MWWVNEGREGDEEKDEGRNFNGSVDAISTTIFNSTPEDRGDGDDIPSSLSRDCKRLGVGSKYLDKTSQTTPFLRRQRFFSIDRNQARTFYHTAVPSAIFQAASFKLSSL